MQRSLKIGHARDREVLDCTRRGIRNGRRDAHGSVFGEQHTVDADGLRSAQQRTEVLGVLQAVEREQERRVGASEVRERYIGEWVRFGDHALVMGANERVKALSLGSLNRDMIAAGKVDEVALLTGEQETMHATAPST